MAVTYDSLMDSYKLKTQEKIPTADISDNSFWIIIGEPFIYVLLQYFEYLEQVKRANRYNQATGLDLDFLAMNIGMERKSAVSAIARLVFSGSAGSSIPQGLLVQTQNELNSPVVQFEVTATVTIATITATTIAFLENSPSQDTITDSNNGFIVAGFQNGDEIYVKGSLSNDGAYTIDTVTPGTMTLIALDDVTAELAGQSITITNLIYSESTSEGVSGNVGADVLNVLPSAVAGITGVTNPEAVTNGVAEEVDGDKFYPYKSDDELLDGETNELRTDNFRGRIIYKLRNNTGKTTKAGYQITALEVEGVISAYAMNYLTNPPHIYLYITVSTGNGIPTPAQIALCQLHMDKDENKDPLDTVEVLGAVEIQVNIIYNVTKLNGWNAAEVQSDIISRMNAFFMKLSQADDVLIEELDNVVHDTAGVYDLVRSSPLSNITVNYGEKATIGTLTINVS